MEVQRVILFVFLLLCSLWDWKSRSVPVWLCYGGALLMTAAVFVTKEMTMAEAVGGMLPGIFLLGIGWITKGQIGSGDGIVFMVTGLGLGIWYNCLLLAGALSISFLWSLLFLTMKKINLKTKFPFLPFVLAAFVLEFMTGG